jgi:hypothetical protein
MSSVKPYSALSHSQKVVRASCEIRIGWPLRSASVSKPWSGCAIRICGSFWKVAATVAIGTSFWT